MFIEIDPAFPFIDDYAVVLDPTAIITNPDFNPIVPQIPLPAALPLFGAALALLGLLRRRGEA